MKTNSVVDGKMTNEELGGLYRKFGEIVRRVNEGTLKYDWVTEEVQKVVEGRGISSNIIPITRGRFNPSEFLGEGWSIISEETDQRSVALSELDLTKVEFVTMLKDGETSITGEEKFRRLKEVGHVRLDADIFLALWENQHLIPESWKEKINGNTRYVFFDGTVLLRDPLGRRYALCLYWSGGRWDWYYYWLDGAWSAFDSSAVLAS